MVKLYLNFYLQTLVYFSSSVQNAFQLTYYPQRFADTPEDEPSAQRRGVRRLRETRKVIDDQVGNNKWVLGERFSAADIGQANQRADLARSYRA